MCNSDYCEELQRRIQSIVISNVPSSGEFSTFNNSSHLDTELCLLDMAAGKRNEEVMLRQGFSTGSVIG